MSHVVIEYHREPGDRTEIVQELLRREPGHRITLYRHPDGAPERGITSSLTLEPGASVLWFTFPFRPYEVAAFHDPGGRLLGHYTNLIRPARLEGSRWELHDLWLDVWQPAGGNALILDEDELQDAVERGLVSGEEARGTREIAGEILDRARRGDWPPGVVRDVTLEDVESLRFRRDAPGAYFANLVLLRIIAYVMYLLGAVSLTTLIFAVLTGAPSPPGIGHRWWTATLAGEALVLLPLAMTGRLPATRRVRPREALNERILALGTVVTGIAVLFLYESRQWRPLLAAVYGALALFLGVFTASRAYFEDGFPTLTAAGLAVSLVALAILL